MKKKYILGSVIAGCVAASFIAIALLPAIVSSKTAKPLVLHLINQRIPGSLQVQHWSLSWLGGMTISGIIYDNRNGDLLANVAQVKTDRGIAGLILSRGNAGIVEIIDPQVIFITPTGPKTVGPEKGSQPRIPKPLPAAEKKSIFPALYGHYKITGGSIFTADGTTKVKKAVATDLDIQLDAAGPENPVTYRFSVRSGDNRGRASGEGSLMPAAGKPGVLENIRTDSRLHIENWQLEDLSAIATGRTGMPTAAGSLDADLSVTGGGDERLQFKGQASMNQLELRGGVLGTDTPTVKKIAIDLSATARNGALALRNLTVQSSLVSGSVRGDIDERGQRKFTGAVDVNLAEVFTQFPATLKLQKGTRIVKGKMALAGDLETTQAVTSFEGLARIDRLQGIRAGKKISWDRPMTAKARGKIGPQGLQLENLSLRSAFLNADGRGDMRNMQLDLSADIAAALKEIKKFIQIKQWNGSGQLKLSLAVNEKSKNRDAVDLKLEVNNFKLRRDNKTIRDARLVLTTRGWIDLTKKSLSLAPIDISGQAGKIHVPALTVADWTNTRKDIQTRGTADLDLGRLTAGYGDFIGLPPGTRLSGKGHFDVDMNFSNPRTQYFKLQGQLAPFKLVSEALPDISEKKVTFNTDLTRSPDGQHVKITDFKLNSRALSLSADGSLDRVGPNKVFKAAGTVAPDLALVAAYLKKSNGAAIKFAGQKATPFTIRLISRGDRWENPLQHLDFSGSLHVASIKAFGFNLAPNDIPIRISGATAQVRLESPANGGELSLQPNLDMRKKPYVLSFPENLDVLKQVRVTRGVTEGLLALIHPLFKQAVKPEGRVGLQMQYLNWPLSQRDRNQASFAGSLRLDGIKINSTPLLSRLLSMMGIRQREFDLGDQTIDFTAENGRVKCSPLTIDVDGSPVILYGSVGFDKSLDYIAKIPLTKKMVGRKAYRLLKGIFVKVPIRGTLSNPQIDQAAIQQATGDLMQQTLQQNLQQGVQNLLQNLLKHKQ